MFGLPEAKHALIPFAGALARITRQLPQPLAMEMLLTGDTVPVAKMAAFGLVNRVVPVAEVLPAALDIAQRIAGNGPVAVEAIKQVVTEAIGRPLAEGYTLETRAMDRVMATEDAREGPRAFMERRKPVYHGR